jgi:hypothetical protein
MGVRSEARTAYRASFFVIEDPLLLGLEIVFTS